MKLSICLRQCLHIGQQGELYRVQDISGSFPTQLLQTAMCFMNVIVKYPGQWPYYNFQTENKDQYLVWFINKLLT